MESFPGEASAHRPLHLHWIPPCHRDACYCWMGHTQKCGFCWWTPKPGQVTLREEALVLLLVGRRGADIVVQSAMWLFVFDAACGSHRFLKENESWIPKPPKEGKTPAPETTITTTTTNRPYHVVAQIFEKKKTETKAVPKESASFIHLKSIVVREVARVRRQVRRGYHINRILKRYPSKKTTI